MSVYAPLGEFLRKKGTSRVPMTFREVEAVIGRKLPPSAYRHRPWWANEERGHSHAKAWLGSGYLTEDVDMAGKKLVFRRNVSARGVAEETNVFEGNKQAGSKFGPHPMIGALKGTFTIEPGWDLTKPALDPEELDEWEASLDRKADLIAKGLGEK
jgi:hypothetical protein